MTILEGHLLYFRPTCPYCQKVLRYMDDHNILLETKDINDRANATALISVGGKQQVPCLVINGSALYESTDIIAYLGSHIAQTDDDLAEGSTVRDAARSAAEHAERRARKRGLLL